MAIMMNYINEEMRNQISPTDSRFRNDIRFYEEGHIEQADAEKLAIETEQRRKRKLHETGKVPHPEPLFFKKVPHPYYQPKPKEADEFKPKMYILIENEGDHKGYWERRNRNDWSDMPALWGPFED